MTGAPELASAINAVELGAMSYLTKPVAIDTLDETVERAVQLGRMARTKREALEVTGNDDKLLGCRTSLEQRFLMAVEQIKMAFQPIVSMTEGRVVAFEALLRTGESTLRNPMAFLSAAERLGATNTLGRAVRRAVALAAFDAPLDVDLYVNLHPLDLLDPELTSKTSPLTAIAPRVVLEITERAALDDVPAVMALCHDLGMKVVTEGIETSGERNTVVGCGGDLLQGYLFGRPAHAFELATFGD